MKRPIFIIFAILAVTVFTYVFCYQLTTHETRRMMAADTGNGIAWLHHEFSLTEEQTRNITILQQAHEPRCIELCSRIANANIRILTLLRETSAMTPELEAAMTEASRLQDACRASTVAQILAISACMSPEQATRYRTIIAKRILPGTLQYNLATHP
jgi:hypothetical protein